VAVLLAGLVVVAAPAEAQSDSYEACAQYGLIVGTGGQTAADAAVALKALDAPNPMGLTNSLDVIINAESDVAPIGSRPTNDAREIAFAALEGYYGDLCAAIDICPLIRQAVATNDAASAEAARLTRGITSPAPPGIDAALAFIAGDIAESPLHNSVGEAQAQVSSYFPCEAAPTIPDPAPGVPADVAATCADLAVLSIPEGPFAIEAAENLRASGAPNPGGIEAALDVIVAAADFDTPTPSAGEIDAALSTLQGYFGGACASIDRCALVNQIVAASSDESARAAGVLRRLETPSPPGIDAALALIAGDVSDSPFHATVAAARDQIAGYYPCGNETDGGTGDDGGLAFTGTSSTTPLAALGLGLLAAGAGLLTIRRRIDRA